MVVNRPVLFSICLACAALAAQADPVGFSVSTRDGVRTASVDAVSRDGVAYVPLGALVRQLGGGCEVTAERAQVDLAEKSAWLRSNNPQVSASLGVFLLGAPAVQTGNDVLIAVSDVAMFFEKAFRLAAKQSDLAGTAPAPVTQLPAQPEPDAIEPLVDEQPLEPLEPLGSEPPAAEPGTDGAGVSAPGDVPEPPDLEPLSVAKAEAPSAPAERAVNRKIEVVVIDAGHGGPDAGCAGPSGVAEADITFAVAQKLQQALEAISVKAVLTRDGERALSRSERVFAANSRNGDLLVSLHAGTAFDSNQRGSRVFVCGEEGDAAGRRYASRSQAIAEAVSGTVAEATGAAAGGVCQLRCQVVQDVGMPGLMIELGMLTNPDEERRLATDEYQSKLAAGIAAGIKKYIEGGNTGSAS